MAGQARHNCQLFSNQELDTLHDRILALGASGAKLLGAGGGGFFLAHGDAGLRSQLTTEFGDIHRIIPLAIDFDGSKSSTLEVNE